MSRPEPPENSEQASQYFVKDKIYYFRSGKSNEALMLFIMSKKYSNSTTDMLGKWREGEIKGQGGSSDDSPRYLVRFSRTQRHLRRHHRLYIFLDLGADARCGK